MVFGRAITNVLQNLRSTEAGFEEWYAPYVRRMGADSQMRYLYELRSRILKQGDMPISTGIMFSGTVEAVMRQFPKPPHAKGFFLGDQIGGCGWVVVLPGGEEEKYYVNLPAEIPGARIDIQTWFADAPTEVANVPVDQMCARYVAVLEEMVSDAGRHFKKNG